MLFEDLIGFKLLLLYVFLRVIESNISYTLAALPDEFLEKQIVSSGLHVVSISFNESLDLFDLKVLAILK